MTLKPDSGKRSTGIDGMYGGGRELSVIARPPGPTGAASNATLIPLQRAGVRGALASHVRRIVAASPSAVHLCEPAEGRRCRVGRNDFDP